MAASLPSRHAAALRSLAHEPRRCRRGGGFACGRRCAGRTAGAAPGRAAEVGGPRIGAVSAAARRAAIRRACALRELPIARKADLMRDFDDWVTDPALRLDALRRFAADRSRIARPLPGPLRGVGELGQQRRAGHLRAGRRGRWRCTTRSRPCVGPPLRSLQRLLDPVVPRRAHRLRRRDRRPLREHGVDRAAAAPESGAVGRPARACPSCSRSSELVAELNALAPTVIATYPSAAVLLAEERLAGRLEAGAAGGVDRRRRRCRPAMRGVIRQAFGCPRDQQLRCVGVPGARLRMPLAAACT